MVHVSFRLIALLAGIMALLAALSRLYRPGNLPARMMERLLTGLVLLAVWNLLLPPLGINPLSMYLAGALGLPGACLLWVLRRL